MMIAPPLNSGLTIVDLVVQSSRLWGQLLLMALAGAAPAPALVAPAPPEPPTPGAADHDTFQALLVALTEAGRPFIEREVLAIVRDGKLLVADVVGAFERVMDRSIPVKLVAADDPLPGIPAPIKPLLLAMETYDSPVKMREVAQVFGVTPTSIDHFAQQVLGK